jgi:peroxiredoxin
LDWRLDDPFGRSVHLHQFCGRVILIESVQSDSPDFEERLVGLRHLQSEFSSWELAIVVLVTGPGGDAPDSDMLAEMIFELDLSFPLLSDPEWRVGTRYSAPSSSGRSIHLYSPGLTLEATGLPDVDESDIEALLPQGGVS